MSLVITINSVDRTLDISQGSLALDMGLTKSPSVLEFAMVGVKASLPTPGLSIVLSEDGTDIFSGTITERIEDLVGGQMVPGYRFIAVDGFHEMDRLLVQKAYNDTDARSIVSDLVTNFMTGFTLDTPLTSPSINTARFNYEQPSRCITKIATEVGWDWYVDAAKVIHFFPGATLEAPFSIEDDTGRLEYKSLEFEQNITELRNRVYVRGGTYEDPIFEEDAVDLYEANGVDQTFPLVYRYNAVQITVNGVTQTVGVDFIDRSIGDSRTSGTATATSTLELVDSGATFIADGVAVGDQVQNTTDDTYAIVVSVDSETTLTINKEIIVSGNEYQIRERLLNCLYNFQEKLVRFPEGTLVVNDVVRVFGNAKIPLIVQAEDPDSILKYGLREGIEIDNTIDSIEEAELLAFARVDQWKDGSKEGSFQTRQKGLTVGMAIKINSAKFGIDETYKINKIRGTMNGFDQFIYDVDFLKSGQTTFTDIVIGLIGKSREEISISPNEVIQRFRKVEDAFSMSDEIVSVTTTEGPYGYGPVTTLTEARYNFATYSGPPPVVTVASPTSITTTTATLNGEITELGADTFITRGFRYSTDSTFASGVFTKSESNAYDISAASFDEVALDVSGQQNIPTSILFNETGTVLYVIGFIGAENIYAYDLSTAYDISTASFDEVVLDVSGQESIPTKIMFNDDGTVLYVLGWSGDDVNAYDLSTPYDISTASFDEVVLDVSDEESQPWSLLFNQNGNTLYLLGDNGNIYAYDLSTPYDISTASFDDVVLDVSGQEDETRVMLFNNTGSILYVVGNEGTDVNAYDLSTAYDISTASFNQIALDVSGQESEPRELLFNDTGTVLYLIGNSGDINAYTMPNYPDETYSLGVTGLTAGTTYYVQAFVENAAGTKYSDTTESFTT